MSLWNNQTPPVLYPNAVATDAGWADAVTGELLVTVTGLSTFKGGSGELVRVGLRGSTKSEFTTSQSLGNAKVFPAGQYIVLEAVFSEPVSFTSGPPTIAATINGNARTFAYFQDTTDLLLNSLDKVMSVTIGAGGTNYQVGDVLTFTGGGGSSAAAVVSSVGGSNAITGITMLSNGAGYASAPTVGVSTGHVVSVSVSGSGTGYINGDKLTFSGGGGTGAAGYIVVDASGNVTKAVITKQGTGYTSAPTVGKTSLYGSGNTFTAHASFGASASLTAVVGTPANGNGTNRLFFRYQVQANETATSQQMLFTSPIGGGATFTDLDGSVATGATATTVFAHGVTTFTVTAAGTGFTSAPTVTISGDGLGATAVAVLDQGVNTVVPVIAGAGYRTVPTVTLSGDSGNSDATVTAVLSTTGSVVDITIGGTSGTTYVNGASLIVDNSGHGGTGFAGTITVSGGDITGVTITNKGSGYTSAPGLSLAVGANRTLTAIIGKSVASYTVVAGTGFLVAPTLSVAAPTATSGSTTLGGGVVVRTTATATATLKNLLTVKSIHAVVAGTGYTAATVAITGGGGTGATATAAVSGEVSKVTITAPGSGYWIPPTVAFTRAGGDTTGENAVGTVVVDRGQVIGVTMTNNGDLYTVAPTVSFTPVAQTPTVTFPTVDPTGFSVDGVAPSISSAVITKDRFGDAITQIAFTTGDFFTVTFNTTKPVFVVNGSGATVALAITSGAQAATYFSGNGTTALHFAYQLTAGDIAAATGVTVSSPIVLAGGTTIMDAAGNALTLTFTPPTITTVTFN